MKICQVLASTGEGGLEKHVRELSEGLAVLGHDVTVICSDEYATTLPSNVAHITINLKRSRWNPFLRLDLLKALQQSRCEIIHAQANKAVALVGSLKKHLNVPVVGTLHNLKNDTRAFARMDAVISVSHKAGERLGTIKHSVVYNGINSRLTVSIDLRTRYGLPQTQPVLCSVGRLTPAKGFDVLLKAIDGLPVSLLIAGEGNERPALQQQVEKLAPPTVCRLIGHHPDPVSLMVSAEGFVLSSHREGFPYVLVEALVNRVPVLCTDVSDVRMLLPKALVVPTNDPAALRHALTVLLAAPAEWLQTMQPTFDMAQQQLTSDAMIRNTLLVYSHLPIRDSNSTFA
jgi:glycosyltransferase involved in cell wall biosynthesis